nr:EOG090X028B [Triops cancriformis]
MLVLTLADVGFVQSLLEGTVEIQLSQKLIKTDSNRIKTDETADDHILLVLSSLSNNKYIILKSLSKVTNIFFDENKGPIVSMKFSPDHSILSIQRNKSSVEFINFTSSPSEEEYSQSCKGKTATILGFVWLSSSEIVFVTDQAVEHYQVNAEKQILKLIKSHSLQINWFVFSTATNLLVLSSGTLGNLLQPFVYKNGQLYKANKIEVEITNIPKPPRVCILERDVVLNTLYQQTVIAILRHQSRISSTASPSPSLGAEIVLYTLSKDGSSRKTHVLTIEASGRFAMSVIDNLMVVHHQATKSSTVFDVHLESHSHSDGKVTYLDPVLSSKSCVIVSLSIVDSNNWVFFQPSIIIDARLGYLWTLELDLAPSLALMPNPITLVEFLLQRSAAQGLILKAVKDWIGPYRISLELLAQVFDKINETYRNYLEIEMQSQMATPVSGSSCLKSMITRPAVVIEQTDVYTHVFSDSQMGDQLNSRNCKWFLAVLSEYIRSLIQWRVPVQHFLYEMLIEACVKLGHFYQLHQMLQYHAISDSKPLACLLLSLESVYPPAYQIALDMLKRLNTANEEIVEVLLSKSQVLLALRFLRNLGYTDSVSARKLLEAAKSTNDPVIFYTVYKFFEQRNAKLKGNPAFVKGEHCEAYVQHFRTLFGVETSFFDTQ